MAMSFHLWRPSTANLGDEMSRMQDSQAEQRRSLSETWGGIESEMAIASAVGSKALNGFKSMKSSVNSTSAWAKKAAGAEGLYRAWLSRERGRVGRCLGTWRVAMKLGELEEIWRKAQETRGGGLCGLMAVFEVSFPFRVCSIVDKACHLTSVCL